MLLAWYSFINSHIYFFCKTRKNYRHHAAGNVWAFLCSWSMPVSARPPAHTPPPTRRPHARPPHAYLSLGGRGYFQKKEAEHQRQKLHARDKRCSLTKQKLFPKDEHCFQDGKPCPTHPRPTYTHPKTCPHWTKDASSMLHHTMLYYIISCHIVLMHIYICTNT